MRRLPDEQKKMQGTYQECRAKNIIQWETMDKIPDPPDLFDEVGATVWYAVCDQLKKRGELCYVYQPVIEAYCVAVMMYRKAKEKLLQDDAKLTATFTNKAGATNEVPSAWFKIMKQSQDTMQTFGAKLGLSPLDIQKLPEPQIQDDDDPFSLIKEPTKKRKSHFR